MSIELINGQPVDKRYYESYIDIPSDQNKAQEHPLGQDAGTSIHQGIYTDPVTLIYRETATQDVPQVSPETLKVGLLAAVGIGLILFFGKVLK